MFAHLHCFKFKVDCPKTFSQQWWYQWAESSSRSISSVWNEPRRSRQADIKCWAIKLRHRPLPLSMAGRAARLVVEWLHLVEKGKAWEGDRLFLFPAEAAGGRHWEIYTRSSFFLRHQNSQGVGHKYARLFTLPLSCSCFWPTKHRLISQYTSMINVLLVQVTVCQAFCYFQPKRISTVFKSSTGCPTIQLSSDIIYLKLAPHRVKALSHKPVPTLDTSHVLPANQL